MSLVSTMLGRFNMRKALLTVPDRAVCIFFHHRSPVFVFPELIACRRAIHFILTVAGSYFFAWMGNESALAVRGRIQRFGQVDSMRCGICWQFKHINRDDTCSKADTFVRYQFHHHVHHALPIAFIFLDLLFQ
jgi:hypothetical protein